MFANPQMQQMMAGMMQQMGGAEGLAGMMQGLGGAINPGTAEAKEQASSDEVESMEDQEQQVKQPEQPQQEDEDDDVIDIVRDDSECSSSFPDNPAFQALKDDPALAPMFEDIKKNGQMAMLKYMSDPAVAAKLGGLLDSFGGLGGLASAFRGGK
mmetsp:Transcript_4220/g.6589  ORF Transcript_4220/g.6589 Transcript_4220/m.6589 type:complete len:155 (+) Transcript_4220:182-646(+)